MTDRSRPIRCRADCVSVIMDCISIPVEARDMAGAIGRQYHKKCYNQDSSGKRLDEWAYILLTMVPMVQFGMNQTPNVKRYCH